MNIVTLLFPIIVFALVFFALFLFDFYNSKTRKILMIGFLVLVIGLFMIPNDILMNIDLPILGKLRNIADDILFKTDILTNAVEYSAGLKAELILAANNIVKMCTICLVSAVVILFTALILLINKIFKNRRSFILSFLSCLVLIAMSVVLALSPVYSLIQIKTSAELYLTREGQTVIETYEEYQDYEVYFNIADTLESSIFANSFVNNILGKVANGFSLGTVENIAKELKRADALIDKIDETGIIILFTDNSFDFNQTTSSTFDFNLISNIVEESLKSEIYYDFARSIANDILDNFEARIKTDAMTDENVSLQFTRAEFKNQYKDILELLEFVVRYDLVHKAQNLSLSTIISAIQEFGLNSEPYNKLLTIGTYPLVQKIKGYIEKSDIETAIYTAIRLYDVLNDWLDDFRVNPIFNTTKEFFQIRGII